MNTIRKSIIISVATIAVQLATTICLYFSGIQTDINKIFVIVLFAGILLSSIHALVQMDPCPKLYSVIAVMIFTVYCIKLTAGTGASLLLLLTVALLLVLFFAGHDAHDLDIESKRAGEREDLQTYFAIIAVPQLFIAITAAGLII